MNNIVLKITAFVFGIALWFFVISKQDFQMTLDIPVKLVRLPEMLAVASKPPHTMPITVKGSAFDLIRLRTKFHAKDSSEAAIVIDLQGAELGSTRKHIDARNFSAPNFPNISFVEPANQLLFLDIELDTKIDRNILVHSNVKFQPAPGYILVDDPKIAPSEIKVSGARNAITRIIEIPTDSLSFDSLVTGDSYKTKLDFNQFPAYVTPSDSMVIIDIDVQKVENKTFNKVPVQLIGLYDKKSVKISPDTVSVKLTGGDAVLKSIQANDIELFVEVNRFAIEDVDSLAPTVKIKVGSNINREMSIKATLLTPDKVTLLKFETDTLAVDSIKEVENALARN